MNDLLQQALQANDPALLLGAVPFARFLGMEARLDDGALVVALPFAEHIIGNPAVPALHGGGLGALLETTAVLLAVWQTRPKTIPRTINLTIDYLRPALLEDTIATGVILRSGRRVVTVQVQAWQQNQTRLVSAAKVHLMCG